MYFRAFFNIDISNFKHQYFVLIKVYAQNDCFKEKYIILLSILILLTQTACNALKPKKVSAKDFPPDPRKRVEKNINEGRGFRVMGGKKRNKL